MALVESLLAAIVRADGEALVMHVGERPYVVVGSQTLPISSHELNVDVMTGMLAQLLPGAAQVTLEEFGAVEHRLPDRGDDRFTVVAARGGNDIWIEVRRRKVQAIPKVQGVQPLVSPQEVLRSFLSEPEPMLPASRPAEPPDDLVYELRTGDDDRAELSAEVTGTDVAVSEDSARGRDPSADPGPAVVVPLTRTVRIEVPAMPASARGTTNVGRLLRVAAARGASGLFLSSESRPFIRVEGDMRPLDAEGVLSREDVEGAILEIAPDGSAPAGDHGPAEWIVEFEDIGRIRCTTFVDHRGPGLLLRMIATRAATAEQLGLSREVQALATEAQGLVLVGGPRGSGKSTLLSALVDLVNRQRAEFVITIERQIRLVHENRAALVSQREIRGGADAALSAARSALREGPDVIVVDDLVSPQMVPLLLTAAAEGLLVFVSMSSPSTTDAVQRFVEMAPPDISKGVHASMAESFRGAVAQLLLKKTGGGQIAAREVLLATAPVARVIGEGQLAQLSLALDGGRKDGMVAFTDALAELVRSGAVDVREAFRKAPDRDRLLDHLKRDGIDTAIVERLA